jgi:hypothetical protein
MEGNLGTLILAAGHVIGVIAVVCSSNRDSKLSKSQAQMQLQRWRSWS